MKKLSVIFIAAVTATLASAIFLHFQNAQAPAAAPAKIPVLDNVVKTGTIRCGYVNWKPFYYSEMKDGNNRPTGLNVDIMTELGKILDLKIAWVEEVGWGTIGEGFKTNRYDMVCTSVWADPAKLKNLSLSRPIFYSAPTFFVRADDTRFDGNTDRINKPDVKIAVIDGAPLSFLVKQDFPSAQIVASPQMVQTAEYLMNVTTKKADLAIMDPEEIKPFMQANPGQLRPIANIPHLRVLPHVLTMPPNDMQFASMINTALQILIDNGVMDKIGKK